MPGPVSDQSKGPSDRTPYVPSWCFEGGARTCTCGHHEGYHSDAGECLLANECGCGGFREQPAAGQ